MKKKEQKYYEYITIRKPTLRLISEVLLRQPTKLLGLRMDTLAQLVTKSEVQSGGSYNFQIDSYCFYNFSHTFT